MEKSYSEMLFNVHEIVRCTEVEGPGKRYVIWFQGCSIRCKGCYNKDMLSHDIFRLLSLQDILDDITKSKELYNIIGVTLLGGEPTEQKHIAKLCMEIQGLELDIILFTGKQHHNLSSELKRYCNTIIDGRFESDKLLKGNLIGSKNQKLYILGKQENIELLNSNHIQVEIYDDKVKMFGSK